MYEDIFFSLINPHIFPWNWKRSCCSSDNEATFGQLASCYVSETPRIIVIGWLISLIDQATEPTLRRSRWPCRWRIVSSTRWSTPGWKRRYLQLTFHAPDVRGGLLTVRSESSTCLCCRWRSCHRGRRPSSSSSSSRAGTKRFTHPAPEDGLYRTDGRHRWLETFHFFYAHVSNWWKRTCFARIREAMPPFFF